MLLDIDRAEWRDLHAQDAAPVRWGAASETGRLREVLLGAPHHLSMVPCNAVTCRSLDDGLSLDPLAVARQHRDLRDALERAGARCYVAPPDARLADLAFTRDALLMTPWGFVELRPAAEHRRPEPSHAAGTAKALGVPCWGRIEAGHVEGGDICLAREGLALIGLSGDRTDRTGAEAVAALFEAKGCKTILAPFDPAFLHLDTIFTMVSPNCAVACPDALSDHFLAQVRAEGIRIIPATLDEVARLGVNLLALGDGRVMAPADNDRLNTALAKNGFDVIAVDIGQFARCGGGIHCLTMPLARDRD